MRKASWSESWDLRAGRQCSAEVAASSSLLMDGTPDGAVKNSKWVCLVRCQI